MEGYSKRPGSRGHRCVGRHRERNEQWPGIASTYKVRILLVQTQTKYQDLMIFESTNHGKVLCLEEVVQLTETDEFIYHEMMVHPVMFAHPDPRRILVIGGGDGGVIRELCKHATVESIDWCEIHEEVATYSTKYFAQNATFGECNIWMGFRCCDSLYEYPFKLWIYETGRAAQ